MGYFKYLEFDGSVDLDTFMSQSFSRKQPSVIRNCLSNHRSIADHIFKNRAKIEKTGRDYAGAGVYTHNSNQEIISPINVRLIEDMKKVNYLKHREGLRFWFHNSDNITNTHYDLDALDVFNLVINGKKRFILTSPKTPLKCWPFISWAVPGQDYTKLTHTIIDVGPGDMIYIPRNWFHQVNCLEDNTVNVNFVMFDRKNTDLGSQRDTEILKLHQLLNTPYYYRDYVSNGLTSDIHNTSIINAIKRLIIEFIPLLIPIVAISTMLVKTCRDRIYSLYLGPLILFAFFYYLMYTFYRKDVLKKTMKALLKLNKNNVDDTSLPLKMNLMILSLSCVIIGLIVKSGILNRLCQ